MWKQLIYYKKIEHSDVKPNHVLCTRRKDIRLYKRTKMEHSEVKTVLNPVCFARGNKTFGLIGQ